MKAPKSYPHTLLGRTESFGRFLQRFRHKLALGSFLVAIGSAGASVVLFVGALAPPQEIPPFQPQTERAESDPSIGGPINSGALNLLQIERVPEPQEVIAGLEGLSLRGNSEEAGDQIPVALGVDAPAGDTDTLVAPAPVDTGLLVENAEATGTAPLDLAAPEVGGDDALTEATSVFAPQDAAIEELVSDPPVGHTVEASELPEVPAADTTPEIPKVQTADATPEIPEVPSADTTPEIPSADLSKEAENSIDEEVAPVAEAAAKKAPSTDHIVESEPTGSPPEADVSATGTGASAAKGPPDVELPEQASTTATEAVPDGAQKNPGGNKFSLIPLAVPLGRALRRRIRIR